MMPVVLVIRDPDESNIITCYDAHGRLDFDKYIIDVDLGYMDLTDPDELSEWAEGMRLAVSPLTPHHPARQAVEQIIADKEEWLTTATKVSLPPAYRDGEALFAELEKENGD